MSEQDHQGEGAGAPAQARGLWVRALLIRARFLLPILLAALAARYADPVLGALHRLSERAEPGPGGRAETPAPFTCPMHPHLVHSGPGSCPECGMPLVPRRGEPRADRLVLGEEAARLAGLRLVAVERRPLEREFAAPASLEVDERRVVRVVTTVKGYVESVGAAAPGVAVRQDQPLLRLVAPDLVGQSKELLRERASQNPQYPLARQRLRLAGLTERQIAELERSNDPLHLDFASPRAGVLLARSASVGDEVMEGAPLFTVADLGRLWAVARVPEEEAGLVAPGTRLSVVVFADADRAYPAVVDSWEPQVDRETRTLGVRALIDNRALALRPGMSGRATFRVPLVQAGRAPLALPLTAVADDGEQKTVWREAGGALERVAIGLGPCAGPLCAVTGLAEGDRVVAEAAFLVAAEARRSGLTVDVPPAAPDAAKTSSALLQDGR
jgi:Cu(I)/Ag(I) efflux system membrane fusion protein